MKITNMKKQIITLIAVLSIITTAFAQQNVEFKKLPSLKLE